MLRVIKIIPDTVVDGSGLRISIYFAGCTHKCKNCHNQSSWEFEQGEEYSATKLFEVIRNIGNKKITLTGGDPLQQKDFFQLNYLLRLLKDNGYNIWVYTGYKYEDIIDKFKTLLYKIDVLVDGKFVEELKSKTCTYRGSTNQRLIDVKQSLKENKICEKNL